MPWANTGRAINNQTTSNGFKFSKFPKFCKFNQIHQIYGIPSSPNSRTNNWKYTWARNNLPWMSNLIQNPEKGNGEKFCFVLFRFYGKLNRCRICWGFVVHWRMARGGWIHIRLLFVNFNYVLTKKKQNHELRRAN